MTDAEKTERGEHLIELEKGVLSRVTSGIIKKIRATGITTVETLSTQTPHDLADKADIGVDTASNAIEKAVALTESGFISGTEVWRKHLKRTRLTLGSKALDTMLAGGIESETTTEITGANGVGKTQICHMLAVNAQLPVEQGGLDGNVAWIDTEDTFRPTRIDEICRNRGYDTESMLDGIRHGLARNVPHQRLLTKRLFQLCPEQDIKLIIVDSMMGLLRSEYIGRGELSARQDELKIILLTLSKVARSTDTTAVYTNQVQDNPAKLYGNPQKAIGGHVMGHAATTRLYLRPSRGNKRIMKIVKSPYLPERECPFLITGLGVEMPEGQEISPDWVKENMTLDE